MKVETAKLGGRYVLEGLIGRGGMASVWRATDTVLERPVAIKRLHARLHDDPELAERFRREGQAVARLSHPNLVRLLDQGQDGDEPFLVFELVEGRDLKTIIRREGRLAPGEAASICAQVARALASAHAAGVVHRDIKSHNVLVTADGVAKLTDFGIARIVEAGSSGLTKTGIVMGSSDYLAPEQAEGRGVDERGDVYSLGVVLFEALTGRLPFVGENAVAVATKHVYESPPDLRRLAPDVPADIAQACLHALKKRPSERFASAAAFASALEGGPGGTLVAHDEPDTGRMRAVRPRRSRRPLAVVAGVAVLGCAGAAAAWQLGAFDVATGGATGGPARPLAITLADHDPFGSDGTSENPGLVPLATDGNALTAWETDAYASANLGGIKPGVGLKVTLDAPATVRQVRIQSTTPGARVQILGPGSDTSGGRPVLGEGVLSSGETTIPVTASGPITELIVWITELPESRTGTYRYVASIGEVQVSGVANR
jgi:serine/threonine-protein kinase